ncbi:FAD-dependent oxidoreductase [Suilimivivens aceti]|uniref:FAD-dependent oxidoreductase n=1 Tax=Suilimivivens aceti TaxID=2981774 RepID=A0ABT2SYN8_9FIRM|nr:FAD-dependent oxidoreductase [Suilimivivens aceti]MCU6743107.1 FAD-dependent oxidoreductase [Suilimivivens aceti]SCH01030.1 Protoporphyrinogen oxidase [uncultured Clostridium sp.]
MEKVKYLILGAGPAGLTFANRLKELSEDSFLVLEKEQEAGGLCRSVMVDGSPFDIGGGHFLDVRRPAVNTFLFRFMPKEEWKLFERDSRIVIGDQQVGHPLEANIWQLPVDSQVEVLSSIARSGCNSGKQKPGKFKDWIIWKLGDRIAEMYMLPYNRKMFADELDELGTYWLEKLPDVSFEDTLRSCLEHRAYGKQPGHASFYYPEKYGYGELWLRMAAEIASNILYQVDVTGIDLEKKTVTAADGRIWEAEYIIMTIPWRSFETIEGMPQEIVSSVKKLKSSAIETRYIGEMLDTKAQWLYIPDEKKPYHRILVRHNFCQGSRGYWLETRKERVSLYREEAEFTYMNEYAYPLNTVGKPEIMDRLLGFCRTKGVYGLGRWGEHCHYNSDLVVELALKLAEKMYEESKMD